MTKQETIKALDYLIDFFNQYDKMLNKQEQEYKELLGPGHSGPV